MLSAKQARELCATNNNVCKQIKLAAEKGEEMLWVKGVDAISEPFRQYLFNEGYQVKKFEYDCGCDYTTSHCSCKFGWEIRW